jgi:predicted permease
LSNAASTRGLTVEGFESGANIDSVASLNEVSPGFFETLSIPLLSGRDFTPADSLDAPRVAVVNQSFIAKFNLDDNPLGKRFAIGTAATELDIEIVGLVGDAKYNTVKNEPPPQFFLSRLQNENIGGLQLYVRSALGSEAALGSIRDIVARVDPNIPVSRLQTARKTVEENVYVDRTIAILSAAFAALATLLAATGLYGVLTYTFAQRTRELGLRLALGATPGSLLLLVMRKVGRMAVVGGVAGLAAAIALGRLAESLLFGVPGHDPATILITVVVVGVVVASASLPPGRRASLIAPMEALRYE